MASKIFTLILFVGIFSTVQAQDPSFSQFYANRIYLNPALTGLEAGLSFAGIYRMQWKNVDNGFRSYSASVESQEPYINSGLGLTLYQDVEGIMELTTTSVGFSYAYTLKGENHNVHIGFQAEWVQKSLDWSKIVFSDQLDPVFGVVNPSTALNGMERVTYTDFHMGAAWRFNNDLELGKRLIQDIQTNIGFSIHHVPHLFSNTGGNESLQNLETNTPPRLTIHAGTIIPTYVFGGSKQKIAISPNLKYDIQGDDLLNTKENLQVFTAGSYVLYEGLYVGAFYQNKFLTAGFQHTNALILALGAYIDSGRKDKGHFFIGFSYDANTTGVGLRGGGVYELAFRWTMADAPALFGGRRKSTSRKTLDCYKFF
ncbi:MAG: PorP/SprF family type IX secretion system membrane protein [Bacteroidota bacterium]